MAEQAGGRLTAKDCITFALECESSARAEEEHADRNRLRRMASVMRDIAARLKSSEGIAD